MNCSSQANSLLQYSSPVSAAVPSRLSVGKALSASSNFLRAWAQRVVAKSAQLRFRLRRKLRPLPCSSFPTATRFAGLAVGFPAAYDSPGSRLREETRKSRPETSPRVPPPGWAGTRRARWAVHRPGPSDTATYSSWSGPSFPARGVPGGWSHRRGAPHASPAAGAALHTQAADDPPLPAAPSWTWSAGPTAGTTRLRRASSAT